MTVLITLFWRLAIFRASPENVPYSSSLMALVLAGWFMLQLLVGSLQTALPLGVLVSSQLLSLVVVLAGTGLLLAFKGLQGRWLQTALSLVGVDVVLTLLSLPLLALNASMAQSLSAIELLYLVLVSWQLAAQSFIYHRALNVGPFLGLGVAMTLLVASYAGVVLLLPEVVTGAQ
ncbi:MAG: hypothetical protein AOY29_07165 [Alcanivorax borkumensis]|jgi:hypothetical protein|uniref:Yip1 domain-containing protein n=1 Tax=Alcanivorax borkumensis (strain ATCC 700651 / DSM 11573 / NCIMB 13689 / SK2) TaxID=393595 RepID=Q0VN12_ALCBS|nr:MULTISPECIES: hypothetical protein [Alcanivorax]OJH09140.1 MAG: hypothetical protein AOY29_07165 [Alcanivorax borkumensis]EUC68222.1 hypothetical protein Y017_05500 [Alcanivorax sp. 97CO-5]PKG00592.1 hypothetical protein Y019_12780 [Alcanivorax sp. 97CO-6]CAL17436.1 hypothetical protein ABO_1988 [Alcanivorax borkumensis SK2]BAP14904.1 hypothetical protein AS19_20530 [Alcanivorax sp. NBRC 101098]